MPDVVVSVVVVVVLVLIVVILELFVFDRWNGLFTLEC